MQKRTAFTLVEILVVISVIALLMSILVPTLNIAKKKTKQTICISNLRQWFMCTQAYAADNNQRIWQGWAFKEDDPNANNWWMKALRNYYDDIDEIRCCPEAKKRHWDENGIHGAGVLPFRAWGYETDFFGNDDYGSYGINGWLLDAVENKVRDSSKYWRSLASISQADKVPLMLDAQWIDAWPEPDSRPPNEENEEANRKDVPDDQMLRVCQNRHRGTMDSSFMDGSSRKVGLKELWKLKWHKSFDTNGKWTTANGQTPNWRDWMAGFKDY